jgi:5-methylcytosine-specific restriction endonuclease McrA
MDKQERKEIEQIMKAIPSPEPDHAKIKWRKRAWHLPRNYADTRPLTHRPQPKVYWDIAKDSGKNVCVCERCISDYKITIHHADGNPWNNDIENLQVLCWSCHLLYHDPVEAGVYDDREGTKADFDNLDDPEIRKFHGIVDDDEDILEES